MTTRLGQLLTIFTLVMTFPSAYSQQAAGKESARENVATILAYFEQTAPEPEVKNAVRRTQALYDSNLPDDSLASRLISLENLLLFRLDEYSYMNYKPYDWEMLLSLFEKTAFLLQGLPPQNENLFYASALYNLAMMILNYGPVKERKHDVRSLMQQALHIRANFLHPDQPAYAECLYGLARAYHPNEDDKALPYLEQAIRLLETGGGKANLCYADVLLLLARIYTGMHRYEEAARVLEKENAVRKEILGSENPSYALRLYITGSLLYYTGEYQKAFMYFTQALQLTKKTMGEQNLQYVYCLHGMGSAYGWIGAYRDALPFFAQSLAIKEKLLGSDHKDVALSVHMLAKTYQRMGLYAQALPLFARASAIVRKAYEEKKEFTHNYGFSLNHLAAVYQEVHQYATAYALLKRAAALTDAGGDSSYHAMSLQNLAILFENTGRYDSALFYLQKTLWLKKKKWGEEHIEYATALDLLSGVYAKTARLDSALQFCKQAAAIRSRKLGEEHAEYAASIDRLGELYLAMGNFDSAQNYLQQALAIRAKSMGPDHPDYVKSLNSLGRLAMARKEHEKATHILSKANKLWLNHLRRTYASLSEQEKINLIREESEPFSFLPSLLYDNKLLPPEVIQQVYANELLLKGMVLDDQQQVLNSIRQSKDSAIFSLYASWRAHCSMQAKQYFLPLHQRMASLDSLQEQINLLEKELTRRSALFRQQKDMQTLDVKAIANTLQKGEAVIEFIRFRYYNQGWTDSLLYAALVVLPGDTAGRFVPLFEEKQLQGVLQPFVKGHPRDIAKLYSQTKQYRSAGRDVSLYGLIWQPLQAYLPQVHTVHFAPAGLLHRISFQALGDGNGNRLIDKYKLNQVLSTRSLVLARPAAALPASASLWGNIAYTAAAENKVSLRGQKQREGVNMEYWLPLPGTKKEIESIRRLCAKAGMRTKVVSGAMATEERFKEFDGNSMEVLHLATHGFFGIEGKQDNVFKKGSHASLVKESNPMLGSSLLLAGCNRKQREPKAVQSREDGILTAYEMAQLDLSKTRLVVLSACNTALGELQGNEGVMGLQRALKMAGVKQMIISLWKVPDKETTELMHLFYQHWLNGKNIRDALRLAQLKMKEKYASPFYWAAFVLVE